MEATEMFKHTLVALVATASLLTPLASAVASADSANSNSPTWFCTRVVSGPTGDSQWSSVGIVEFKRAENGKEKAALEKQGYECTRSQQAASQAAPEPTPSTPQPPHFRGPRH